MKTVCVLPLLAAPLATLAAVPNVVVPVGYMVSDTNVNTCPEGSSLMTKTDTGCAEFANANSDRNYIWATEDPNDDYYPKGCFCQMGMAECFYNSGDSGGTEEGSFRVCKSDATPSPTSAPWDLEQKGVSADFTSSASREIAVIYEKGKGRNFTQRITAGTCDAEGSEVSNDVVSTTIDPPVDVSTSVAMERVVVRHVVNLTTLVTSNIYDNVTDSIRLCQEAQLSETTASSDVYVISKLRTDVTVVLNMTASFDMNVTVVEGTIAKENQTVQLEDQVEAYRCKSLEDTSPMEEALGPNQLLHICVKTLSADILIESIETMIAKGTGTTDTSFPIIEDKVPSVAAITKTKPFSATLHVVETRLPINRITYTAENRVDITGTLNLKLGGRRLAGGAVSAGRRLQATQDAADEEAAGFALDLALAPAEEDRAPVAVAAAATAGAVRAAVLVVAAAVALVG